MTNAITISDEPKASEIASADISVGKRTHLSYLDGLRGLAALYVVTFHVFQYQAGAAANGPLPSWLLHSVAWLGFGRGAVCVFIVLSGYCLTIPLAKPSVPALSGGVLGFLKRRAWRILPPYYAALALSLLIVAFVPGMNKASGRIWDGELPAFTPSIIASHIFMIQNLSGQWIRKINTPMWSVATEWDIYILFAVLIIPLWRRLGLLPAVGIAWAIGAALPRLTHHRIDGASPDFIGLFCFGMAAAAINFSENPLLFLRTDVRKFPWGSICLVFFLLLCAGLRINSDWVLDHGTFDELVGLSTACLLIYCTNIMQTRSGGRLPLVLKILGSKPVVALGLFSYSLYLIHAPVLALVNIAFVSMKLPAVPTLLVMGGIGIPSSVIAAYLFHLAFEKRFMTAPGRAILPGSSAKNVLPPASLRFRRPVDLAAGSPPENTP